MAGGLGLAASESPRWMQNLPTWAYAHPADPDGTQELESAPHVDTTAIVDSYLECCKQLGATAHPSVLIFLSLRLATLQPIAYETPYAGRYSFLDRDLHAFCDLVLHRGGSSVFEHWQYLDLDRCIISPAGCQLLALVLRQPACRVSAVNFREQKIGCEGAAALVSTLRLRRGITHMKLKLAFIEDHGADEFLRLLSEPDGLGDLQELDLSNNMLSFEMCTQLEQAAATVQLGAPDFKLVLSGNSVLDEVLNASSHFVGFVLAIIGSIFLGISLAHENNEWFELHDGETYNGVVITRGPYTTSITIYIISLIILYLASTLFHATFALDEGIYGFFTALDFCSIYFLIAGSFSPFLAILFPDKPIYSVGMLSFLWALGFSGVLIVATYRGPFKIAMLITSYVAMGWTFVFCGAEVYERLSPQPNAFKLIIWGGVLYTGGVPFNVRNKRTLGIPDHTIWHLFVIAGSMAHYFCILWYVVPFPYMGMDGDGDLPHQATLKGDSLQPIAQVA